MRVGFGFDIHPLVEGRPMVIGGVHIPFERGLSGHSDADVMAHAVADALLGAAGLGDIGEHFPDFDEKYKDFDSMQFLREIERQIHFEKFEIANIDISLVLQAPKITSYKEQMKKNIAKNLFITQDRVNVKATTAEKLGFVGREEGVICYAVALLQSRTAK
jgi:2-C-methyl-D-erythritol 2,4-cyclodiphosphate synthase